MIGKFVDAWLLQDSAVVAAVATATDGKPCIFPAPAPQREPFPRLTYEVISDRDNSGRLDGPGTLRIARVQITAWATAQTGYAILQNLFGLLLGSQAAGTYGTKLHHYRGKLAGIVVQHCRQDEAVDSVIPPIDASEAAIQGFAMDFIINYEM